MAITKEFLVKDVINYELTNDVNILEELEQGELYIILDLIKMGNNCSDSEAESIFNQALADMDIAEIVNEIAECLIGKSELDNEPTDGEKPKYKNYSEVLLITFENLQSVGDAITYSEFMSMNTHMLYKYADGVQKRYINNKNAAYRDSFENAAIFAGTIFGKIKEPPQIKESDINKKKGSVADQLRAFAASRRTGDV